MLNRRSLMKGIPALPLAAKAGPGVPGLAARSASYTLNFDTAPLERLTASLGVVRPWLPGLVQVLQEPSPSAPPDPFGSSVVFSPAGVFDARESR